MKQELKEKLLLLADKYEVEEFIMDDPIQFPIGILIKLMLRSPD